MYYFKGTRAYLSVTALVLLMQMFKLTRFVHSMTFVSCLAAFLTIGLTVKLVVFDKRFKDAKYWLLLALLFVQEIVIGLDSLLSPMDYDLANVCMLCLSGIVLYSLDAPSVRKYMDEDAYILKNSSWMLTIAYIVAICSRLPLVSL